MNEWWSDTWNIQHILKYTIFAIAYGSLKNQDFNRFWTCDLVILERRSNKLSYEATNVGTGHLRVLMSPWGVHNCEDHGLFAFKSAVQYMIYFTYQFIIHSFIMGSLESGSSLIFQASICNCKNCVHNYEDQRLSRLQITFYYGSFSNNDNFGFILNGISWDQWPATTNISHQWFRSPIIKKNIPQRCIQSASLRPWMPSFFFWM